MQFHLALKVVTVGHNPEMADISNPRGEIRREAYTVIAEAANGRRWEHDHTFVSSRHNDDDCGERAEALRGRIALAYAAGRKLDQNRWREIDPCYGSEAYVEQDVERHRWEREREDGDEWA